MFPAQALAEALLAKGWRVKLSTDPRGARYVGGFPKDVEIGVVKSATFARGGLIEKALAPWRILSGSLAAWREMKAEPPSVVVGFGGYPSIPALAAAVMLKRPRMLHEQNGVLGRVNQLFAKRVDVVACGTWPTELPEGVEGVHVGNPVRASIMAREGAPYIPPGDYPMQFLVLGGSQGARILSDVVPGAVARLPDGIKRHLRVSHQARPEDIERVEAFYSEAGIEAEVKAFFDDVPMRMAEAQLVVCRSGASTIADLGVIGRPSVLIPFPAAAGDHQTANARQLVEGGAAILIPQSKLNEETLAEQMSLVLSNPDGAMKMAHAAMAAGRPDATARLVDLVEELAGAYGERNG